MKLQAWLSNNESHRFNNSRKHEKISIFKSKGKGTMSPFSTKLMDMIKICPTGITT